MTTKIGEVMLKNPVLCASGTFGYGDELLESLPLHRLGGIVTKGLTLREREGNPPPRLVETPSGLLNSVGLENIGVERFLKEKLPRLREIGTNIVVNINGETVKDFEKIVDILDGEEGISALEVNVACPNVERGGMQFGQNPSLLEFLISSLKRRTSLPLWVKLTPNFVDIVEEAKSAERGGADALCLINTLVGAWVDVEKKRFSLGYKTGGLSGPAVRPVALYMLYRVVKAVSLPIIGVGGITDVISALQFIFLGAQAIQIGTANMYHPEIMFRIIDGIDNYLKENDTTLEEIRGILQDR